MGTKTHFRSLKVYTKLIIFFLIWSSYRPLIMVLMKKLKKVAKTLRNLVLPPPGGEKNIIFTIPIISDVMCINVPNFMKIGEQIDLFVIIVIP